MSIGPFCALHARWRQHDRFIIAIVIFFVSIIWAWTGVELMNFPRQLLCLEDWMLFILNVGIFNFVAGHEHPATITRLFPTSPQ